MKEGRLEFAGGGWVGQDEACPIYADIIENIRIGHAFLNEEFGITPKIGWLVDTFGHSNTNAKILAEMGMDALFVGRIDHKEKQYK